MAVSAKAFSARLETRLSGANVGSFFTDLLAFIKELMPLITTLPCFMASKKKLQAIIDEEFRAGVKKKRGRTAKPVRKLMKKYGVSDADDQDEYWHLICAEGFADSSNVADALIAAA